MGIASKIVKGGLEAVAKKAPRMSEALEKHVGKRLYITQADRTKLDYPNKFLGGSGFVDLSEIDPALYADKAWAVQTPGIAKTMVGSMAQHPEEAIWTNLQGSPYQHRSNRVVFDKIMDRFYKAVEEDKLTPELHQTINRRLANIKDPKTGKTFFPEDIDILSPEFDQHANTFHQRAFIADILGGKGVGGKKGSIIPYEEIMRETTDPLVLEAKTGDIGNRLFSLSGNIEHRPELHPAFHTLLGGRKESDAFKAAPQGIVLKDYYKEFQKNLAEKNQPIRLPTYYDLTRGYAPNVKITDEMIENLNKEGYAGGGIAKKIAKTLAKDYKPTKGKISEVKDYIRDAKGEYGAQRVERAADLVPNLEKQYSARALREAFDGDNAKSVMVINPADYENYARKLPETYGKPVSGIKFTEGKQVPITIPAEESYYDILTGKNPLNREDYTTKKMNLDAYLDYLGKTAREEGLLETPYLMLDESLGKYYQIAGHEGRHRARALSKLGDESTLIRLLPRGIREGLPRSSQEEYQEGLKKLLGPNPRVYPERPYGISGDKGRSLIELPDFFAKGGSVDKDPEQLRNIIKGILGSDIEKDQDFGAGGVVKNIAKKLAKELPEASASGKTPISTTVGTYKKASPILLEDIKDVNAPVLDYGSGMGLGAEELRKTFPNVKTLEPFYKGNFDFTDPSKVPSGEFKGLTNFSVLNAVTPEVRDSIVENIGRVMDRGGVGLITARSPSAVMSTKGKLVDEPNAMITQKGTYQKGFDTDELREYIKYILGSDFEYEPLKGLSGTSVKVKKKADGGTITTPEIEVTPEYETLKEVPRIGKISGKIADVLKPASRFLEKYEIIPQIPLIGGTDLAELTGVKGVQTLAEDMSYGYKPIRNLERGKLQASYFDPRILDAVDLTGTAVGVPILAKNLGKTAIKEGMRQIETGTGMLGRNVINPRMNIIKDQGGMLVGGEKALDNELLYMKKTENAYPHAQPYFATDQKDTDAIALNNWIDTKVRKYLRNQAGTEADPILKTIESGVEHNFQPALGDTKYSQKIKRASVGKPEEGIAKTELGKEFEYKVDSMFNPKRSEEIKDILNDPNKTTRQKELLLRVQEDLPIEKLSDIELINQIPDKNVYTLSGTNITDRLGLNHVSDVLMEDLRSGKLTPEQLNQMSIEKAIRRTAEYDAEKAKAMAKANASSVEGMPIPKQYDDGYKWVELKHDTDPKKTQSALKSEGEMMGHCVGGYCPEVESGEIKIFSLRSPDGKSHVTIEARPQFSMTLWRNANMDAINSNPKLKEYDFNMNSLDNDHKYGYRMTEQDYVREMTKEMKKLGINPVEPPSYMELHQVKGKQNKRPDDKYQSYISDFVKNNPTKHEIVSVEELQNTNLMNVQDVVDDGVVGKNLHFHPDVEKIVKNYPKENLMAMYRKGNVSRSPMEVDEDIKYNIFKEAAKDLARQNKSFIDNDDMLNHLREKYLLPKKKSGGSINLNQEYKLENMRRRYG